MNITGYDVRADEKLDLVKASFDEIVRLKACRDSLGADLLKVQRDHVALKAIVKTIYNRVSGPGPDSEIVKDVEKLAKLGV